MASLRTAATVGEGQSILRVFNISSCVTGDTIAVPINRGLFVTNNTTTDAISCTYSKSTGLVTITVANTPDVSVWVLL